MVNMLLCGEGKTEHGYDVYHGNAYEHTEGVIQIFLRKLINSESLSFVTKTRGDI